MLRRIESGIVPGGALGRNRCRPDAWSQQDTLEGRQVPGQRARGRDEDGGPYAGEARFVTSAGVALARALLTLPALWRAVAVPHLVDDARAVCRLWAAL